MDSGSASTSRQRAQRCRRSLAVAPAQLISKRPNRRGFSAPAFVAGLRNEANAFFDGADFESLRVGAAVQRDDPPRGERGETSRAGSKQLAPSQPPPQPSASQQPSLQPARPAASASGADALEDLWDLSAFQLAPAASLKNSRKSSVDLDLV